MRCIAYASTIALALMLATTAAQADPDPALPGQVSDKIVNELAKTDLDALAGDATKYMPGTSADDFKKNFASVEKFGKSNYVDLVYSRDYGKTEKDMIYKIDFANGILFVRFLWHIHNGDWRLMHLTYKDAESLPLPEGWQHIYPK
jgi:hypothetical protein